ncbi:hypothetical protein [Spelaeicoccus albus]|uniref:Uncharacterized protein n=1 Tax=Spelaeicoccus albus TaxID=1280376 RepID=A0A7Z0AB24_9MICO|nr:hypothetical protein [Spelaeicoccus albus]NYI66560.1 hypothetical protein [Spelaeicoccus albus]
MSDGGVSPGVEKLRRWEDSGAIWQVLFRSDGVATIGLMTCTAGEEVDRLVTDDPAVLEFIGDRMSSEPVD